MGTHVFDRQKCFQYSAIIFAARCGGRTVKLSEYQNARGQILRLCGLRVNIPVTPVYPIISEYFNAFKGSCSLILFLALKEI
jgi:hypothetical protein